MGARTRRSLLVRRSSATREGEESRNGLGTATTASVSLLLPEARPFAGEFGVANDVASRAAANTTAVAASSPEQVRGDGRLHCRFPARRRVSRRRDPAARFTRSRA